MPCVSTGTDENPFSVEIAKAYRAHVIGGALETNHISPQHHALLFDFLVVHKGSIKIGSEVLYWSMNMRYILFTLCTLAELYNAYNN